MVAAFGFGRRVCPGQFMAYESMWIAIASTLAAFNINKTKDEHGVPITPGEDYIEGFLWSVFSLPSSRAALTRFDEQLPQAFPMRCHSSFCWASVTGRGNGDPSSVAQSCLVEIYLTVPVDSQFLATWQLAGTLGHRHRRRRSNAGGSSCGIGINGRFEWQSCCDCEGGDRTALVPLRLAIFPSAIPVDSREAPARCFSAKPLLVASAARFRRATSLSHRPCEFGAEGLT